MSVRQTIREPARDIPVFRTCDVLVVGGGPAGSAAAASAAQLGADTMLVERYGHLGGMSTGGFVLWIDRMTDWQGRQVITGFANDLLDRLPKDAVLGPPADLWGSKDAPAVAYWRDRHSAFQGTVTWAPTVDPEMLKMASLDLVLERGVSLLLHAWVVAAVQEGSEVRGAVFESKSGRQAIVAKVVIDATGDGDVFALAGAPYDTDTFPADAREEHEFVVSPNIHDRMTLSSRWGGVDMERYLAFRRDQPAQHAAIVVRGREHGVVDRPHAMPRNDVALFMAPKMSGYSCLDVEHLTAVEIEGRRRVRQMLDFYRREMPGFERAWLIDTSPQIGTRHSRRLVGVKKMSRTPGPPASSTTTRSASRRRPTPAIRMCRSHSHVSCRRRSRASWPRGGTCRAIPPPTPSCARFPNAGRWARPRAWRRPCRCPPASASAMWTSGRSGGSS